MTKENTPLENKETPSVFELCPTEVLKARIALRSLFLRIDAFKRLLGDMEDNLSRALSALNDKEFLDNYYV